MNNQHSQLATAVRRALVLGVGASMLALPAQAQDMQDMQMQDEEAEGDAPERIQVTGSRILREGAMAPAPVTVISGEELIDTGAMNIGEVMSRLPALASTYTLSNSGRFIGTAGVSLLDLRGMGTSRTLVLVDGRRHVASSTGSASVDTNTIPSSWIDRVEIITGGASAVYGADAVTGVVNFILKDDIDGFDASVTKGWADNNPYENERLSVSYGTSFDDGRGNIAFAAEYNSQDSLNALDHQYAGRSWASFAYETVTGQPRDPENATSPDHPDRFTLPDAGYYDISEGGSFFTGNPMNPNDWYTFGPDGQVREQDMSGIVDPAALFCQEPCDYINLRQYNELQPQFDRINLNTRASYEFNQDLRGTLEAKYVRTEGENIGQPFFHFDYNNAAAQYPIHRDNPFVRDDLAQLMDDNGLDQVAVNKMHNDLGRRQEENTRETTRIVASLEGNIGLDWSWDGSLVWGKTELERINNANVIIDNFTNAVDAVADDDGNIVCRDPDARAAGCVPVDIMGRSGVTPEAEDYILTSSIGESEIEQFVATVNFQNNMLFELPAGYMGFAGGVEYRDESSTSTEDPLAATGATFFNALGEVDGSFDVSEVYGELSIPLIEGRRFADEVVLDTALRYADYSTVGSATSWKVGLEWSVNPELRARFTVSEALRAPNISDLFSAQSQTFYSVSDPCRQTNLDDLGDADTRAHREAQCQALGVPEGFDDNYDSATLEGLTGGNPDLEPEESTSYTAGIVYQPEWLPGFSATIDYWQIDIDDTIASLSAQRILTECLDAESIDNQFCDRITRSQEGNDQGQITLIENFALNIARSKNSGVDFEFGYDFDALGGSFRTSMIGTYLIEAKQYPFADDPDDYTDFAGVLGDAEQQLRFTVDYIRDGWTFGSRTRYTNGVDLYSPTELADNPNPSNIMTYGSYAVTDVYGGYAWDNGVSVRVGIDNVFDRDMPANTDGTGAGSAYYDNIGRFGYIRASYSF